MSTPTTSAPSGTVPGTWIIDPSHSEVGFTVRHLMTKVRGHFESFEGTITTGDEPALARAEATIEMQSVGTRSQQRDAHLRSADFFDTENHPHMRFTATSFEGTTATGNLTIKGITREVVLSVDHLGRGGDPWGGTRIGFTASGVISRKDFGIDFNIPLNGGGVVIGDRVTIEISIQAVLAEQGEQA
ncbi:YceI family protein [Streptomyces sp. NPDC051840]|uniref:YceI family protein n=1 Tax=unclassified Streptomyces TaxID=2593676 RepID=UPI003447C3B4